MGKRNDGVEERDKWIDWKGIDTENTQDKPAEVPEVANPLLPDSNAGASVAIANTNIPWLRRLRPRNHLGFK